MEMSKFRPESHVAQQSRRDKLRVQQSSNLVQHLEDFPNSLEQASSVQPGLNPDLVQVRNVRNANLLYDSTVISSGLTHLSTNSDALPPQRDAILHQELQTAQENQHMPAEESSFSRVSPSILSKLDASSKFSGDPQGCGNWKSVDSQHSCDWMVGYASGLAGRESNQNPMFFGEVLSNNARESNISAATQFLMPDYSAYQDVQPTLSNLGSEISPSLYHNALQDVVTTASQGLRVASLVHQNVREAARGSSIDYCGNQASPLKYDNAGAWMNRPLVVEHCQQWGGELGFLASKSSEELGAGASDAATQGLSLSLSSNPTPKISGAAQFTEDQCGSGDFNSPLDSKTLKPGHLCLMQKASVTSKGGGNTLQDTGGTSNCVHRQTGPLGPFTGYATILKNSRFLKPAQELLGEFCLMTNSKLVKVCDISEWISGEVSAFSADAANAVDMEAGANKGNNLEASASTFYSSNEIRVDVGVGSSSGEYCRPEYQQRKAKLLYLQEEVCRRYKLYRQQMQMVVSSFESVAGLSAATPYISLALKTVARDFRCLRNAISGQIRHISRATGEDLLPPTTGTSFSKGDINMSRLKYVGQKSGGVNMGFLEPQQHGWRPQRGLPERSVAILRGWLFEHFLHPYPTDTDKHILATQTGLSRNQVSNWFINARVRVWKPMVEEIHMLESKGLAEGNQNLSKSDGKSTSERGTSRPNEDLSINGSCINAMSDKQLASSDMLFTGIAGDAHDAEHWNHEKRSRMDFHIPTSMEGSLMCFAPYEQSRLELGGLGAVSLTLGLRQGVESAQQHQQQYQRQEDQLRRQFGGQMVQDFAG
ncbi:BEL1-like homeodomain protein 8 isoform X1 [Durio zibethinus]|uniref:BEL1-like homeodomain protein 8 isoform X1 n=1 Tax=Durio zibethinus TaxID=66656 RepID=A0A6P5XVK7_DURZI|nr:BEL1-like homeodomain protein 8 isoform X1 [Durio zibethinus]